MDSYFRSPPRIAIDASRAIRPRKTGVEWYAFRLIEALAKIAPPEWQVRLLTDRPSTSHILHPTSWSTSVLPWPPRYLWSQIRLAAHLQRTRPDLFFSPVHVLPFFATSPAVVTIHDVNYATHPEAYSRKGRAYLQLTTRFAVKHAARIFAPSEATKRGLIDRFGAAPEKIAVTPLAPIIQKIPSAEELEQTRKKYSLTGSYFVFVGRLETKKNIQRIIAAFETLRLNYPELKLVLIGRPGRGYDQLRSSTSWGVRTSDGRSSDGILELGWLDQGEAAALLAGALALVFPSLAEGFGLPILDAFTLGTPVITSRGLATEEVAGDAALLVDPLSVEEIARAMERIYKDEALRQTIAAKGLERVKSFSWERTARETIEIFKEVLGEPPRGSTSLGGRTSSRLG